MTVKRVYLFGAAVLSAAGVAIIVTADQWALRGFGMWQFVCAGVLVLAAYGSEMREKR